MKCLCVVILLFAATAFAFTDEYKMNPYTGKLDNVGPFKNYTAMARGGGGAPAWGVITGTLSNQTDLQTALNSKESSLGNPVIDGYVLSSTVLGARSWVAPGAGGMIYPGAGIANSTGAAWGTSYGTSGSGSVALTTSPVFTTPNIGSATGSVSGNAGTASALAALPTACSAGQAPLGILANGNSTGCFTPAGTYSLPTATSSVLGGVKPDGTSILNTAGVLSATYTSVGADVAGAAAAITTISGNAGTATKLQTARAINGVNFDGTAPITVADSTKAPTGLITSSGLTLNTGKLLGRNTAAVGAVEEITLGTNLSYTGTTLNAAGGAGTPATTVTTETYGAAGVVGTSTNYAREDHLHAMPASTKDTTAITGILKGNGSTVSAATVATDYTLINGTGFVKSVGTTLSYDTSTYLTTAGNAASATKSTNLISGNSTTLLGSIPYQSNTDTTTLLAPNTTVSQKFLAMTGDGTNGAAPSWQAVTSTPGPIGSPSQIAFNDTGTEAGDANLVWDKTNQTLKIGSPGLTLANNPITAERSVNGDVQINVRNSNNGVLATANLVATADNGTDTTKFVNLGINGSTYTDANFDGGANDSYLLADGGNMQYMARTAGKTHKFYTGGTLAGNVRAIISDTGLMTSTILATAVNYGIQSIATAGTTTTFTAISPQYTIFTGSLNQTVVLPDATTLLGPGQRYEIDNNSSGIITVQTNGGATLTTLAPGADALIAGLTTGTAAGTWNVDYMGANVATGKVMTVNNSLILAGTDGTTMTFPTTSKTVAANDGSNMAIASQATGDLITAASATTLGRVADVAVGQVLTSGGVGAAPVFSATPTVTSVNKVAITAPATSATLTIANGATLQQTGAFTLNLTATAASTPTFPTGTTTLPQMVCKGTAAVTTTAVASGVCQTTVTATCTNALTTDAVAWSYASFAAPATDGRLILNVWTTAGNVNVSRCNPTAASITPSALTVNFHITR